MADNKVNFLRGTSAEYEASAKDNDTFYYTTDDEKLYLGDKEITGGGVTIDDTLSDTSKNPVQNKVVNAALNNKANLSDIPTELPANGGNADTVDGKHASDFMQNLGYLNTGSLLDYVLTMTKSGYLFVSNKVTDTPVSGQFFFVDVRRYAGGDYAITATRFNAGGVYTNRYNNNSDMKKWYGWANVADGGNADTLDGKHASDFTLSYIRNNKPLVTSILTLEAVARLTWLPVDGATKYAVSLYIDGKYVQQSTSITNTYYDIQNLTPGTVYLALVQAYVNGKWSAVSTDDLVHFYTMPVASATSDGLVTTGSQTFAGNKTFNGQVIPAGASAVGTAQARKIYAGTSDMTAGTTALETGAIYLVYE